MKKKKLPQFAKRKKAFDCVLQAYRDAKNVQVGVSAVNIGCGGKGTSNPCQPNIVDFRADVELVFHKVFKSESAWRAFEEAYINFDSEDYIEREVHAQSILGETMHSLAQGLGAEFIKRGIFPLHGKGSYFRTIRRTK
jgi:hypothetical protein